MRLPAWRRCELRCAVVVPLAALLHGCGQTGPLFLPEEPTTGSDADASAIATPPDPAETRRNADEEEDDRDE